MEQGVIQKSSPTGATGQSSGGAARSIYETLRQQIVDMELLPDATLSRSELAERYGVSLTPLREAMHELEQDGLIRIYPQSKTVVTRIDEKALHETQFLRVAVETEVVRRLCETPSAETVSRAQAIVQMQTALIGDTNHMDMFLDLDRAFHRTLFEGVGMSSLNAMVARRLGHLARCQRLELPMKGKMQAIADHHARILEGIAAMDIEAATTAVREHLSGTIRRVSSLKSEFPDYFS